MTKWKMKKPYRGDKEIEIHAGDIQVLVDYDDVDHSDAERVARAIASVPAMYESIRLLLGCMRLANWENDPTAEAAREILRKIDNG